MKVLIVDDHILFREGLAGLLGGDDYFQVVGQAGSVQEAIDQATRLRPDLILMDFSLPDGDGSEASAAILEQQPDCKIVFLTMYDADEKLFAAIRSGAKGYLLKNVPATTLVESLKSVNKGEAALSGEMTMRILEQFSQSKEDISDNTAALLSALSQREIEILCELSHGSSNHEIAGKFYLSVNTVKHHIHNILSKLGSVNRKDAVRLAVQAGIIKQAG